MNPALSPLLAWSVEIAFVLLLAAFAFSIARLLLGPTLADRIVALDLLSLLMVGTIALFTIRSGQPVFLDAAIALALVTFFATIAYARYVIEREPPRERAPEPEGDGR